MKAVATAVAVVLVLASLPATSGNALVLMGAATLTIIAADMVSTVVAQYKRRKAMRGRQ